MPWNEPSSPRWIANFVARKVCSRRPFSARPTSFADQLRRSEGEFVDQGVRLLRVVTRGIEHEGGDRHGRQAADQHQAAHPCRGRVRCGECDQRAHAVTAEVEATQASGVRECEHPVRHGIDAETRVAA